jgi:micrococcal nuclease
MKLQKIDKLILLFLVLALIFLNYPAVDNFLEKTFSGKQEAFVERIIDGDTIETDIGNVRLLGINTPEKGERYYEEAKSFLENEVLNKNVTLEFIGDKQDKYRRTLAYIFLGNENINIKVVEEGFANYYFYDGRDKYSDELEEAWDKCLNNNQNLCEKSDKSYAQCVNIINFDSLINLCQFSCNIINWTIKGEGREKFIFNSTLEKNFQVKFKLDITNSGGSLFLRDEDGKLVEWKKG